MVTILAIQIFKKQKLTILFPYLLGIVFFINLVNSYIELDSKTEFTFELETCKVTLATRECYQEYISQ